MRRKEDFRPENRRAYRSVCVQEDVREYERRNKRKHSREADRANDKYYGMYNRYYRTYEETYSGECRRESEENIYRELTKEGQRFCAVAGLLEEIVVLAAFGIQVSMSPLPVLAFLWVLFVILTAAALIGVSCLLDRIAAFRPMPEDGGRVRSAKKLPAYHSDAERVVA